MQPLLTYQKETLPSQSDPIQWESTFNYHDEGHFINQANKGVCVSFLEYPFGIEF